MNTILENRLNRYISKIIKEGDDTIDDEVYPIFYPWHTDSGYIVRDKRNNKIVFKTRIASDPNGMKAKEWADKMNKAEMKLKGGVKSDIKMTDVSQIYHKWEKLSQFTEFINKLSPKDKTLFNTKILRYIQQNGKISDTLFYNELDKKQFELLKSVGFDWKHDSSDKTLVVKESKYNSKKVISENMKTPVLENKLKRYIKKVISESRTVITAKQLPENIVDLLKKIKFPMNKITEVAEYDKFIEVEFDNVLFDANDLSILSKHSDIFSALTCLKGTGGTLTLFK